MDEKNHNEQNQDEMLMMVGTGGSPDYFMFGTAGPIAYGFKPLFRFGRHGISLGGRIRMANLPDTEGDTFTDIGEYLEKNPSLFSFATVDEVRASAIVELHLPAPTGMTGPEVIQRLEAGKFTENLVDFLKGFFPVTNEIKFADWINGKLLTGAERCTELVASQQETLKQAAIFYKEGYPDPIKFIDNTKETEPEDPPDGEFHEKSDSEDTPPH